MDRLRALFNRPSDLERCRKTFNATLDTLIFLSDEEKRGLKSEKGTDPDGAGMQQSLRKLKSRAEHAVANQRSGIKELGQKLKATVDGRKALAESNNPRTQKMREAMNLRRAQSDLQLEMFRVKADLRMAQLNLRTVQMLAAQLSTSGIRPMPA